MLHLKDRLGRAACRAMTGGVLDYVAWRFKLKSETCKQCAAIYRSRKQAYVHRKFEKDTL